jgi:hypothetical protein
VPAVRRSTSSAPARLCSARREGKGVAGCEARRPDRAEQVLDEHLFRGHVFVLVAAFERPLELVRALDQVGPAPQQLSDGDEGIVDVRAGDDELNAHRKMVVALIEEAGVRARPVLRLMDRVTGRQRLDCPREVLRSHIGGCGRAQMLDLARMPLKRAVDGRPELGRGAKTRLSHASNTVLQASDRAYAERRVPK